jgi:cell fate (sporulation/competence/biofilm development) regulator YlbF (YheA/YmcA/DUF963 family)
VKVDADFKKMNILWVASDMGDDGKIEKTLKSIAGQLRHELSVLRLMGEVPQINFVKDRVHMKTAEIDAVLKHADFGEDFVPNDPTLFLKTEPKLEMKIPEDDKLKLMELESIESQENENTLPPMRHDTFGLDHAKMMNKIVASLNKTRQAWEQFESSSIESATAQQTGIRATQESITEEVDKLKKEAEMRENFVKFLENRQWRKRITPDRKKSQKFLDDEWGDDTNSSYKDLPDGDYLDDDDVKR